MAGIDLGCGRGAASVVRVSSAAGIPAELGAIGFAEAKRLLRSESLAEGREWARRLVRLTAGAAAYWHRKALSKGRRRLTTSRSGIGLHLVWSTAIGIRHRTTSRMERRNRELRRRERMGTVGTEHNLLALLQYQGLSTQPPNWQCCLTGEAFDAFCRRWL